MLWWLMNAVGVRRIVRAFLTEEQKIVKKVLKSGAAQGVKAAP